MTINPHFNFFKRASHQDLAESLVIQCIQRYGLDIWYLPRTLVAENPIYTEDASSKFESAIPVEMYVKSIDGFTGRGDILSVVGLQIRDQLTMTVAKKRFQVETSLDRPREGDLIFFPLNGSLFEIRFVENEVPFYQLGKLYTYDLQCELFEYSHQIFNTGIPEIDSFVKKFANGITVPMDTGTGNFVAGETVFQGTNVNSFLARGVVHSWNSTSKVLIVDYPIGQFAISAGTVYGATSGAAWSISTEFSGLEQPNDPLSDSKDFQTEAESGIVDFSETNPFGEGNKF